MVGFERSLANFLSPVHGSGAWQVPLFARFEYANSQPDTRKPNTIVNDRYLADCLLRTVLVAGSTLAFAVFAFRCHRPLLHNK